MERIKAVWSIDFFSGGVKWGLKRGIKEVKWNLNYVNYRGIKPFLSFREVVDIHFETLVVGGGGSTSRPGGTCTFRDSSRSGGRTSRLGGTCIPVIW